MQKQTKCREATLTLNKRQETLLNFTVLFFMKNSAVFEGFVLTNVHLHCLKCFPLHFFKYYCQSYKMAQNPVIPEKGKSDATHTHMHTHLQYKHVYSANGAGGTQYYYFISKLNDWRIYCGFTVCQMSCVSSCQYFKPNSRNHVRMRSLDMNTSV